MTIAAVLAGAAGAVGVLAAWDALVVAERDGARIVRRIVAPLARTGRDGVPAPAGERRRVATVLAVALLAGGWLLAGPGAGLALAAAGPVAGRALTSTRMRRWRADLADGAPAIARALADALSGGHSIHGAIAEAAARGGVPGASGSELARAARGLAAGERLERVLESLRDRARAPGYDALVAAILLQRDAGGDLAGLLRELAASLEESTRQARAARAVTAQARFTGVLVAGLPAGAAAVAELAQPGFLVGLLRFGPSAALLVAAAVLQAAGLLAVRRLARL
jgi:tight adherence protein B